jgi:hypothetical protein
MRSEELWAKGFCQGPQRHVFFPGAIDKPTRRSQHLVSADEVMPQIKTGGGQTY